MLPGSYPLTIYRGDTAQWTFTLWADAAKTTPTDLTGSTAAAHIRQSNTSLKEPVPMTCSIELPNIIHVSLPAAATASIPARGHQGQWDLQLTNTGGVVQTVLAGSVSIVGDVTRLAS